jgi:hypothetical protein
MKLSSVDQWRRGLDWTIIDRVKRLRCRLPCFAVKHVPQRLLRRVGRAGPLPSGVRLGAEPQISGNSALMASLFIAYQ